MTTAPQLRDAGGRPFIDQLLREGVVIHEREEAGRWLSQARADLATAWL